MKLSAWLLILTVLFSPASLRARQDDIRVTASVSTERAFVGDPIELEVAVEGSVEAERPRLESLDGLQAEYMGEENRSMTSLTIINGRRVEQGSLTYIFKYRITPLRPGPLKVPPIAVRVDGAEYATQPVWIEARPAQASEDFILRVEAAAGPVYIGQPVRLHFTWYIGGAVYTFRFSGETGDGFELLPPPPPPQGADPRQHVEFDFLGIPAVGVRGSGSFKGRTFSTFSFSLTMVPTAAGRLEFGPINLGFDHASGRPADTPFLRQSTQRMVIASNTVELMVLDLPAAGRPRGFSGLVGAFGVEASATPVKARVGDPIQLAVRVSGSEPMVGVAAPRLESVDGFTDAFKLSSDGWTELPGASAGERVFATTIRPRAASATVVPPIGLDYFDPEAGEYRRAESRPIALEVEAAREVTAADATGGPVPVDGDGEGSAPGPPERVPLGDGPGGILAGARGADQLLDEQPPVLGWLTSPAGASVLVIPVLLFIAASSAGVIRRALAATRRRALRSALRDLRRAGSPGGSPEDISAAIREYIGRVTGREPQALTAADCGRLIEPSAPALAGRVTVLLGTCESARFGGRTIERSTIAAEASSLLRRIDQQVGRRS